MDRKAQIAQRFISLLPYSRALKMHVDEVGNGHAVISMPYDEALIGDPETRVIHGGAVSALMDTCGGASVMAYSEAITTTATLDLRIDYMRAAAPDQRITARAECFHVTRTVAFVRATAFDEDGDRPVATAAGAFTIVWSDGER